MDIVSNKGFNEISLIAFSNRIAYELPNDYIDFLRDHNGGYVKNSISAYYNKGEKRFYLTSLFGLGSEDDLFSQFETYKNRIPSTCIPIGRDAGGNLICLNLSKDNSGNVYFWDHEEEHKFEDGEMLIHDLYSIAGTFSEFLNSIKIDKESKLENTGYKVKKVWVDPDFLKELENNSGE